MSNFKLLDNGFITIKEDNSHASPISSVFMSFMMISMLWKQDYNPKTSIFSAL
jgi:hypothetical protein